MSEVKFTIDPQEIAKEAYALLDDEQTLEDTPELEQQYWQELARLFTHVVLTHITRLITENTKVEVTYDHEL